MSLVRVRHALDFWRRRNEVIGDARHAYEVGTVTSINLFNRHTKLCAAVLLE